MASRRSSSWLDAAVGDYALAHATPPDPIQQRLIAETTARTGDHAGMQIGPDQGAFMEMLTRLSGARSAVEVGTFTGYSALCLARGLPSGGRLLCCDVSEEWPAIGRPYWEEAGVADKIDLRIGPAADTLRGLPESDQFDLAFIDADKANYATYYEEILLRLRRGGLVMIDNTLWAGRVVAPDPSDADSVAIAAFNDALAADERVDTVLLTLGDGLTLARKR